MRQLLLAILLALAPRSAAAQESAALMADSVTVTADERLIAEGNVQAFYEGATLSAARITYDRRADQLLIEGPILVREADGTILTAERAELDPRLEQGLLRGARLVLDRRLQLAANRIDRLEGITALTGAAVTSCQVCPGRAPLWEIRAGQVVYDEAEGQLYFEDASFLIRGLPVIWLPRLRLPDPGNERTTGLLLPRLRASDDLGFGIELPYFVELGPYRDLTLYPYLSSETLTLGARFRQAFVSGDLEVTAALSSDSLAPGEARGYLEAQGEFRLAGGYEVAFAGALVGDDEYLGDYGLLDGKVLESGLRLARTTETTLVRGNLSQFRILANEEGSAVPSVLGNLSLERRTALAAGTLTFGTKIETALSQEGNLADSTRIGTFAKWQGDAVIGYGLVLEGRSRLGVDAFSIGDESLLRAVPAAAVTVRWPLVRRTVEGLSDLLEPSLSLAWSAAFGDGPPNEDSRLPELDEANIFALFRFPGEDAVEEGARLSTGLDWTRQAPGFDSTLFLGRIVASDAPDVGWASALAGARSDWLLSGQVATAAGLLLQVRTQLDDSLEFARSDALLGWDSDVLSLDATYVRLPADPFEGRTSRLEEVSLNAEIRPSPQWTLGAEARYDIADERAERVGIAVGWRNECVEVDVGLARRYTSPNEDPSTEFGLSIDLLGFSASGGPRVEPGMCRG